MSIRVEGIKDLLDIQHPAYLVKPLFEMGATAMLFGPSGLGKSYSALSLALCVATGTPFGGLPTVALPVVYINAEGGRGFGRRVKAWVDRAIEVAEDADARELLMERLETNFWAVRRPLDIAVEGVREALAAEIRSHVYEPFMPIGLIVVDTLARCAVSLDENKTHDMTKFVDAMVDLKARLRTVDPFKTAEEVAEEQAAGIEEEEAHEPVMLVVHHSGKVAMSERGDAVERGSSALRAALDVVIAMEQRKAQLCLTVQKLKDGEPVPPMAVTWDDTRIVQYDVDGQPIVGRVAVVQGPGTAQTREDVEKRDREADRDELDARILSLLEASPQSSIRAMATHLEVTKSSLQRRLKWLAKDGKIELTAGRYSRCMPSEKGVNFL